MPDLHPLFTLSPPMRLTLVWLAKANGEATCCPYGITRGIYNSPPMQAIEDRRIILRHLREFERLNYATIGKGDPAHRHRCECTLTDEGQKAAEIASEWLRCVAEGKTYRGVIQ